MFDAITSQNVEKKLKQADLYSCSFGFCPERLELR